MPELLGVHGPEEPLRIWIAGCSRGEEAYSIAIQFREGMADLNASVKLQISAFDVARMPSPRPATAYIRQ